MARRKPSIFKGPASQYAGPQEAIYEVAFPGGVGGLIAVRVQEDGTPVLDLYRFDARVDIRVGPREVS